jgi:hypothetical protein
MAIVDFMLITMTHFDIMVNIDALYNFDFIIQNVFCVSFSVNTCLKISHK